MSRFAILNPTSLVGKEIKEALEKRRELWSDIRLLTMETDDYGLLSEVAGEATVVQELSPDNLEGIDLLFACPDPTDALDEIQAHLSEVPRTIFAGVASLPEGLATVVAGASVSEIDTESLPLQLVSPHPAAIGLAHLLHPLRALGLNEAVATVVQPASARGQAGIDELLEQTRAVLTFNTDFPRDVFRTQLALNLVPAEGGRDVLTATREALGTEPRLAIQLLQGAVFHSISASVLVRCAADTSAEDIEQALEASPLVEIARDTDRLGPIDASAGSSLLVAPVRARGEEPGEFWLWAVMDNLTLGGAGNALAIAETLLGTPH